MDNPPTHRRSSPLGLIVLLALLPASLLGCRPKSVDTIPLRIAVLPVIEALPLYVAEAEGHFADEGLEVNLIPVGSAAERDQLLQAGQIDGMITDLIALILYNQAGLPVQAIRYAMVPTPDAPQFRVVASSRSGITTPAGLKEIPVGISEGTIIDYVTRRLLEASGLEPEEITTIAVPRMAERMALLDTGGLAAATLPEPLGSLALQQGAVPIVDDTTHPTWSCSLYAFRGEVLELQPEAVARFVRAIDRAVAEIHADPELGAALAAEQQLVPTDLLDTYRLPDFPARAVATAAQFDDALLWLAETGRVDAPITYSECITDAYVRD